MSAGDFVVCEKSVCRYSCWSVFRGLEIDWAPMEKTAGVSDHFRGAFLAMRFRRLVCVCVCVVFASCFA